MVVLELLFWAILIPVLMVKLLKILVASFRESGKRKSATTIQPIRPKNEKAEAARIIAEQEINSLEDQIREMSAIYQRVNEIYKGERNVKRSITLQKQLCSIASKIDSLEKRRLRAYYVLHGTLNGSEK